VCECDGVGHGYVNVFVAHHTLVKPSNVNETCVFTNNINIQITYRDPDVAVTLLESSQQYFRERGAENREQRAERGAEGEAYRDADVAVALLESAQKGFH
jgi:hypothetical protein